jgi:hypothetical protein
MTTLPDSTSRKRVTTGACSTARCGNAARKAPTAARTCRAATSTSTSIVSRGWLVHPPIMCAPASRNRTLAALRTSITASGAMALLTNRPAKSVETARLRANTARPFSPPGILTTGNSWDQPEAVTIALLAISLTPGARCRRRPAAARPPAAPETPAARRRRRGCRPSAAAVRARACTRGQSKFPGQ